MGKNYIASALAPKLIDFVLSSSFDGREEAVFWWKAARLLSNRSRCKRPFVHAVERSVQTLAVGGNGWSA